MLFRIALLLSIIATPVAAEARSALALSSDVFVERTEVSTAGKKRVRLETPSRVVPGDQLVFVVRFQNDSGQTAKSFIVTNPMPAAVSFVDDAGSDALLSVDGGKNWGRLEKLQVAASDGRMRPARADDVTHIRWQVSQGVPAGQAGKFLYRGRVK